jgi:hypothetical protein
VVLLSHFKQMRGLYFKLGHYSLIQNPFQSIINSYTSRRWVDNIKMDLRQEGMVWTDVAQDRDQWRSLVNTIMKLRVP